jgi:hypothetical protein
MTPTTTEPLYFDLGETRSFKRRRLGWFPGVGDHGDCRLGTVRVIQEKTRGTADVTEYGVEADFTELPPGCRAFILRNDAPADDDPQRREFYRIVVGPGFVTCTCTATTCKLPVCKHRSSVLRLLEEKLL